MLILVSYDIPNDKRRLAVANALLDFGRRVQYSVFECDIEEAALDQLRHRLRRFVVEDEDSVRLYRICAACQARIESLGLPGPKGPQDVYIV